MELNNETVQPTAEELAAKVAEISATNAKLVEANKKLAEDNKALKAVNKSLQAEVVAATDTKAQPKTATEPITHLGKTFEVDGTKYGINYPKTVLKDGRAITADTIVADKALQAELVEAKHSIVKAL